MGDSLDKKKLDQFITNRVRQMRVAEGISQEALADFLKVSPGYIGQIESYRQRAKYNLYHLNEIAKMLGCSPKDFLPDKPL